MEVEVAFFGVVGVLSVGEKSTEACWLFKLRVCLVLDGDDAPQPIRKETRLIIVVGRIRQLVFGFMHGVLFY